MQPYYIVIFTIFSLIDVKQTQMKKNRSNLSFTLLIPQPFTCGAWGKVLDSGVAPHPVLLADGPMDSGVQGTQVHLALSHITRMTIRQNIKQYRLVIFSPPSQCNQQYWNVIMRRRRLQNSQRLDPPSPPQGGGEVDMKKGGRGKLRRKKIKNEDEWAQIVI